MPRLLILLTLPPDVTEQYRARLSREISRNLHRRGGPADKAAAALQKADMLLTFGQMMKNLKLDLAAAGKLKWVQALGTGLDGITDQPALKPSVTVTSLHGVHGAPVSEAALASMLALSPRPAGRRPRAGRASVEALAGEAAARQDRRHPRHRRDRRGAGAEMQGDGHDGRRHHVVAAPGRGLRPRASDAANCMRCCRTLDYLVLLTPYSPATHHMIDAKVFAAMKPTSYFINVARGGVVDEDALIEALRDKKIAGAALDVFNQEPLPADHPLWDFKNVIITTHQGGFCDTYVDLAMPILEHNMRCFLKGDLKGMMNVARPAA